jgi:hypothetical protein
MLDGIGYGALAASIRKRTGRTRFFSEKEAKTFTS